MLNFKILLLLVFISVFKLNGQNNTIDSLVTKSFESLQDGFIKYAKDTLIAKQYTDAYIKKATKEKDSLQIAKGYYFKVILNEKEDNLNYLTKIIDLTKNINNNDFPTIAYFDLGVYYYDKREFKKALDNLLLALSYNDGSNKEHLQFIIKSSLGNLKTRVDDNEDALLLFKNNWEYIKKNNYREHEPNRYLNVLFSLTDSYRKNNKIDSAYYYNSLGLKESNILEDKASYYHFLLNDGVLNYDTKKYSIAFDTIQKGLNQLIEIDNKPNIAVGYYYLGKLYDKQGNTQKAISYFKEVDTIFQITNDVLPEIKGGYNYLYNYYKINGPIEQELVYLEKLIVVDSTLNNYQKYLSQTIKTEYDIPLLINEKEKIIERLNTKNSNASFLAIILAIISLFILLFGIYQYQRKKILKERFNKLVSTNEIQEQKTETIKEKQAINIPDYIVSSIISNLEKFETQQQYLNIDLNLNELAAQFNTNTKYLSKTINYYKEQSFSNYLKDLRITYAFNILKEKKEFRRYTIKAIANECGFKGAESFSKTFNKKYEIYPSYFIRQLDKFEQDLYHKHSIFLNEDK